MLRSRHAIALLLSVAAAAVGLVAGCATTSDHAGGSAARKNLGAADYYPLAQGWKWAYDLEKDGEKILAVYAVLERTPDTAIVQAGEDRLVYAITPEGVAQKEGAAIGDYVIKNPLSVGAGWPVAGGTAKVTSVSDQVTVGAGHFADCVIVETTRTDPVRIARTTFAPEVGPVAIEFLVQSAGQFVPSTRASLRTVTRPGEDLFK
jgi:hypothetical protein